MIAAVRATSLASRFLATLLITCILPLLVFGWFTLGSVRSLIDAQVVSTFVPRLCADHAQKIEDKLRQIYQSCAVVREIARRALDSAEDLAAFEEQVELVPDLLDNYLDLLLLADASGRVAWWQDGQFLDPGTRGRRASQMPQSVADAGWFLRVQNERHASYLLFGEAPYLKDASIARPLDPSAHHLALAFDVPQRGGSAGALLALIRWQEVQRLLDGTRAALRDAGYPSAEAMLIDGEGVVRGHTDRGRYGEPWEPEWLRGVIAMFDHGEESFVDAAGRAMQCGFHRLDVGAESDFALVVTVPAQELFSGADAFARVFLFAIGATLFVLLVWSLAASRAIARPVREMAAATRRIASGDLNVQVPAGGGRELGELAESFNGMTKELAAGRERLAVAEREKAWAEMARQVAHEIKNPLTPMRMAAQLLLRARKENDPRADAVAERLARTVETQTEELARIADDFRQFAGAPSRSREAVLADDFLRGVVAEAEGLFPADALRLEFAPGANEARVAIDAHEMRRVFINLLQNAAQAKPSGVRVRLSSSIEGAFVVVRIKDDGPGLDAAVRERLFEPYFTTKTAGTGLGLAICRRIVESHHGRIRLCASGPDGAEFAIELPIAAT